MNTSKLTAMSLLLLVASVACRQPATALAAAEGEEGSTAQAPERPAPEQPTAAPAATTAEPAQHKPAPPPVSDAAGSPGQYSDLRPPAVSAPKEANTFAALGGELPLSQFRARQRDMTAKWAAMAEGSALLTTEPVDEKAEGEWREDLAVMDKLLRDAVGERHWIRGYNEALAIRLKTVATADRVAGGMYVEGAGVIISTSVNWPLANAPRPEGADPNRAREPDSPWDRAKRQIKGHGEHDLAHGFDSTLMEARPPMPAFEQKKLDDLIEDILDVLPQASNFRHLKETESVFVTVAGMDDAGKPVRLTIKARKSDIDEAAAKKIDAQTFKQRVAMRVG